MKNEHYQQHEQYARSGPVRASGRQDLLHQRDELVVGPRIQRTAGGSGLTSSKVNEHGRRTQLAVNAAGMTEVIVGDPMKGFVAGFTHQKRGVFGTTASRLGANLRT